MPEQSWGSDVPVSMPEPLKGQEGLVPMFGFTFTVNGLFHDLTEADHEELSMTKYAPVSPATMIWDDQDLQQNKMSEPSSTADSQSGDSSVVYDVSDAEESDW